MVHNKKDFSDFIEREGIQEFLYPRSWKDVEGTPVSVFEMENDRYGVIYRIYPPFYASAYTESKLESFFAGGLPEKSSVQFFVAASNNLSSLLNSFDDIHSTPSDVHNPQVLNELKESRRNWIEKHQKESIFKKRGIDVRLTNYVNLCTCTIPRFDTDGNERTFEEVVNIFSGLHSSLNDFSPQKFSQAEYVILMDELISPDIEPTGNNDSRSTINTQIGGSSSVLTIEENGIIGLGQAKKFEPIPERRKKPSFFAKWNKRRKDNKDIQERTISTNWFAKCFTTKMFPEEVSLDMLNSFFVNVYGDDIERTLPSKFILSLTVFMDEHEKLRKEVHEKAQWNMFNAKKIESIAKFFPEVVDRTIEADMVNEAVAKGETPRRAMFSAVVIDNSISSVEKYGEALKRKFKRRGWILQEEELIPHAIFLYSLPLQFEETIMVKYLKRMNTLFDRNCASITPVVTGENGFGAPVLVYVDRAAGLVPVDIFHGEPNKNFLIAGASGSGKSYFTSNLIEGYLSSGTTVRVIDVGGSYKILCSRLGGQYIEFSADSDICLNFFTNIRTNEDGSIDKGELKSIVPLIGLMAMQLITMEDGSGNLQVPVIAGHISEAVNTAFEKRNRGAGMQDVLLALEAKAADIYSETSQKDQLISDLIVALYPFSHRDGEYFTLFNGSGNLKFENDFTVVELQELSNDERLRSVVLAAVTYQIGEEFFFDENREKRKMLIAEEIDAYTKERAVLSFIEGVGRRIRKHNGALGVVTQFLASFFENSSMKAIFNSCPTKIMLKQAAGSVEGLVNKGEIEFDPSIVTLLSTLKFMPPLYAEFMIKRDSGSFFIGRLITTRKQHWINTQDERDIEVLARLRDSFSVSTEDARLIQGSSEEDDTSVEEEYRKRLQEGTLSFKIENVETKENPVEDFLRI